MARTSSFPLYDQLKFDGRLAETLTAWRDDEKLSVDEIAFRLRSDHGVVVSRSTVARWLVLADGMAPEPKDAA